MSRTYNIFGIKTITMQLSYWSSWNQYPDYANPDPSEVKDARKKLAELESH
jgi:hypothetical protein